MIDEGDGREAADCRAHRVTGGVQADGQAAPAAGGELADDDVAGRKNSTDADARDNAQQSQLLPVLTRRGQ